MTRHLHPIELDLLVDGDGGFGLAELAAHASSCPACGRALREARIVAGALDAIPHVKPAVGFADRVMARVQVYQPWYVAAWEGVDRLVPSGTPVRRAVVGLLATGTVGTVAAGLILATRAVGWTVIVAAAVERGRGLLTDAIGTAAGTLMGPASAALLGGGSTWTVAAAAAALLGAVGLATGGLVRAGAAMRRREGR